MNGLGVEVMQADEGTRVLKDVRRMGIRRGTEVCIDYLLVGVHMCL